MSTRLVADLVEHVNSRHARSMQQALELIDNYDDARALLFAVVASNVASLTASLAANEERYPLFAKLSGVQQLVVVTTLIGHLLDSDKLDPTEQDHSNMLAAGREIRPGIRVHYE